MSKPAQTKFWLIFACVLIIGISVALVTFDLDRIT